jgi:hypothetical protein
VRAAKSTGWAVLRFGFDALIHLGMMMRGTPLTILRSIGNDPSSSELAELYDDKALRAWLGAAPQEAGEG